MFAQLLLQHKYGTLTCLQITSRSRNVNATTFPRRQAGLIPKSTEKQWLMLLLLQSLFFFSLLRQPVCHRLEYGSRWYRDLAARAAPRAHPAVLVDGSQSFHGHISDMAPPEQDLSWKKEQTWMLEKKTKHEVMINSWKCFSFII